MSKFRNICKQSNGLTTGRRALPLGLLSVLLTLTGCKSETPDEPLSFSDAVVEFSTGMSDGDELWSELPETARSTRAIGPINSLADLKALTDGFGVFAYFTDATIWTDAISGKAVGDASYPKPDFMFNQPVVWNLLNDNITYDWTYSPPKYWPNSSDNVTPRRISFFAYAPWTYSHDDGTTDETEGIVKMTNATDKSPHIDFVQPASPTLQTDLLWASCADATRNGRGLVVLNDNGHTYQKVPLTFKHALACVEIYVQRMYDEPTYSGKHPEQEEHTKLFISKLKLQNTTNITNSGTLNLSTGNWDSTPGSEDNMTFAEALLNDAISSSYMTEKWPLSNYGVDQELRPLFKSGRPLMIMPQDLTLTPTMTYTMLTQDNSLELSALTDSEGNKYARIDHETTGNQISLTLQGGKKYWLVLHIGVETVRFEVVSVVDWDFPMRFNPETVDNYKDEVKERTISEQ